VTDRRTCREIERERQRNRESDREKDVFGSEPLCPYVWICD